MAKPGDVIEVPDAQSAVRVPRDRGVDRRRVRGVRGRRPPARVHHAHARPRGRDRAPRGARGRPERQAGRQGSRAARRRRIEIPPGAPHYQRSGGEGIGRVRIRHTPAGQIDEFIDRLGETLEFNRLGFPKPVAGARFIPDLGASGHASLPQPEDPAAARGAVLKLDDREYEFVDEWDVDAPPEAVFDVLADGHDLPAVVEAGLHRRRRRRRASRQSHQHFKGRLPYHLHTRTTTVRSSARTGSRARPTATCAAPASGRSPRARAAARTCASTGACTPTASCSARSPRSCVRPCAGTTTGRSPARWTGWSRSSSASKVAA